MTCGKEGCNNKTRWPNRSICWKNGLCQKHFWGSSTWRYKHKKFRSEEIPKEKINENY